MTAPTYEIVHFEGREYKLCGFNNLLPPVPRDFGIYGVNIGWDSSCWHGFYRAYGVIDKILFLTGMTLIGPVKGAGKIAGKRPRPRLFFSSSDTVYRDLKFKVKYTGKLILVAEHMYPSVRDRLHSANYLPHMCRFMHELIFEYGFLANEIDHSNHMESLRTFLRERISEAEDPNQEESKNAAWLWKYIAYGSVEREELQIELKEWAAKEYGADYDTWWLGYVP